MKYTCCRGAPSSSRASTILAIQVNVVLSVLLVSPAPVVRYCRTPSEASHASRPFVLLNA